MVWKPSVNAPTTAYLLVRAMMDAGLPPGVVNVVNGRGRGGCGRSWARPGQGALPEVCFYRVPRRGPGPAASWPGAALVPCSLELGGRNPMIVMPDATWTAAVRSGPAGRLRRAGQRRASLANLIVHQDVAGAFREAVPGGGGPASPWATRSPNPEVTCGPMINARCAKDFEEHWAMGREDGARLLCGGAAWTEENRTAQVLGPIAKGSYMQPCVWDGVTPEMRLFKAEVFGPSVNLVHGGRLRPGPGLRQRRPRRGGGPAHPGPGLRGALPAGEPRRGVPGERTGPGLDRQRRRGAGRGVGGGSSRWRTVLGDAGEAQAAQAAPAAAYEPTRWDRL